MLRLIRNPHNTTEIWLTNGMERRHVTTLDEANWWKWQIALATPVDTRDAVTASVEANVPVSVFDSMKVVA